MRALSSPLRKQLESAVLTGRRAAEAASRGALEGLGVFADRRPEHLDVEQAALRNGLRAKWRQLGGDKDLLVGECAYEQWHRLLFARFLAENELLLHPQYRAPVTLEDCEELAGELGEPDGWSVAARFAAEILPGIFRLEDPCVRLRLAPEGRHALEQVIAGLPAEVFAADDALGWVYQFWQKDKKDEVNASERKIGGADLGPVTQLFTENYMVRFLLENSLGAWWASRHPDSPLVAGFEYLRFNDDGKPTAGSFDGWPERVEEVTIMDPCCGSGHFLVEAFSMLWQMRAEEEELSSVEAQDAVLRDNLFGLELDPRCVQIATFAVALQAWKVARRWRPLPAPNIACSGMSVKAPAADWQTLANGDQRLENMLVRLHSVFHDADTLGSLIDPRRSSDARSPQQTLEDVDWEEVAPLVEHAVGRETLGDPAVAVLGHDAEGVARAAAFLARSYTLVATNVPFLGRNSQVETLRHFALTVFPAEEADLATMMATRTQQLGLTTAIVIPHNWLFMSTYEALRAKWINELTWRSLVRLGPGAFREVSGEVVKVALWIADTVASRASSYFELDATSAGDKAVALRSDDIALVGQHEQLNNPKHIVIPGGAINGPFIRDFADVRAGLSTGDAPVFVRYFWEVPQIGDVWERLQSAPDGRSEGSYSGCSLIIMWENESGRLAAWADSLKHLNHAAQGWRRGKPFWGKSGVAVKMMGDLAVAPYTGERYDASVAVISPEEPEHLSPIWGFCSSDEFEPSVRLINGKLSIESGTLLATPFDRQRWKNSASIPEPCSDSPTQWLFDGRPEISTAALQVCVARLLGFQWPAQDHEDTFDQFVDADGLACLPSVAGEPAAADRLQEVVAQAFGDQWSPSKLTGLLEQAGSRKKNLRDWLRDDFFKQHCALFGNRPFVWHIWDGQRDGFSALVNYHRLDRKTLEKLTYTYLGQDWVERQRAGVRDEVAGAEARLAAALELQRKLEVILTGEVPYDIYVRWKELHEQPVGWEPDLNDGVRLNIRPFIQAEVLRAPFNIHWNKDRGKNPDGSERHNDIHLSLAEKLEARRRAGRG